MELTSTLVFDLINAGALVFIVVALIAGWVVPSKAVDRMLEEAENRTTKVANEIKDGIERAVSRGIQAGITEVRNGGSKSKE